MVADIVAAGGKAEAIQGDFSKPEEISKVYGEIKKSHEKIEILVNIAGVYAFGPIDSVTPRRFTVSSISMWWVCFLPRRKRFLSSDRKVDQSST